MLSSLRSGAPRAGLSPGRAGCVHPSWTSSRSFQRGVVAVPAHGAVRADDPVAGHHHGDGVAGHGVADRPGRPRIAGDLGQLPIADGLARRDRHQRPVDGLLERSAPPGAPAAPRPAPTWSAPRRSRPPAAPAQKARASASAAPGAASAPFGRRRVHGPAASPGRSTPIEPAVAHVHPALAPARLVRSRVGVVNLSYGHTRTPPLPPCPADPGTASNSSRDASRNRSGDPKCVDDRLLALLPYPRKLVEDGQWSSSPSSWSDGTRERSGGPHRVPAAAAEGPRRPAPREAVPQTRARTAPPLAWPAPPH